LTQQKVTDYVGNKIYEQQNLKRILIEGGYIENNQYHFYLTDHLGNNRVVANATGGVIQKNHYYPFGMPYAETSKAEQLKQPYKFGDKELDQMHGLNHYDFSARYMDGIRFTSVDPRAEDFYNWTPYMYSYNNPIRFIDPTGEGPGDAVKGYIYGAGKAAFNRVSSMPAIISTYKTASTFVNGSFDQKVNIALGVWTTPAEYLHKNSTGYLIEKAIHEHKTGGDWFNFGADLGNQIMGSSLDAATTVMPGSALNALNTATKVEIFGGTYSKLDGFINYDIAAKIGTVHNFV
jgi:RHS repeat-associated protein